MQKLLTYFLLTLIILACKKEVKPDVIDDTSTQFVSFPNRPEIQNLNPEAQAVLSKWPEFQEFQNSFEVMYRAQNNEDLVLAIDDLLVKEKALRDGTYPEEFDKLQIKSRQKVLRTFLLKMRASLAEKTAIDEPIKQMLVARNAFRDQFNIIVSNKLDTKLILDEN
ncbi:hypothetical protein MTsPCn9_31810 [Croceitalea sp. MTPC9]|uniref:hypothetical protein n=1 Tax=unclassified Croceitalea TaxID=2632280 RepID=UPI002B3773F4|nr:hypothetical protein MTsPCn6_16810 [Croceitalea sp. MTPC6]GMN18241.1 hypothetical protein MTsPCn9_31810 [Croceitalea sp. MTPC9]